MILHAVVIFKMIVQSDNLNVYHLIIVINLGVFSVWAMSATLSNCMDHSSEDSKGFIRIQTESANNNVMNRTVKKLNSNNSAVLKQLAEETKKFVDNGGSLEQSPNETTQLLCELYEKELAVSKKLYGLDY